MSPKKAMKKIIVPMLNALRFGLKDLLQQVEKLQDELDPKSRVKLLELAPERDEWPLKTRAIMPSPSSLPVGEVVDIYEPLAASFPHNFTISKLKREGLEILSVDTMAAGELKTLLRIQADILDEAPKDDPALVVAIVWEEGADSQQASPGAAEEHGHGPGGSLPRSWDRV